MVTWSAITVSKGEQSLLHVGLRLDLIYMHIITGGKPRNYHEIVLT